MKRRAATIDRRYDEKLTPAAYDVLMLAMRRPGEDARPTLRARGAAFDGVVRWCRVSGFLTHDEPPRVTEAGRVAVIHDLRAAGAKIVEREPVSLTARQPDHERSGS